MVPYVNKFIGKPEGFEGGTQEEIPVKPQRVQLQNLESEITQIQIVSA